MRAKAIVPFFAAAVVALLLPAGAAARTKPASRQTPPTVVEEFKLPATNGYTVTVAVSDRHKLTLSASSLAGNGVRLAEYGLEAPQAHGSDDIKARIGRFGRIDVKFIPNSVHESKPFPSNCRGGKTLVEEGHFVGLIAFRGARDFTRVRAGAAPGSVTTIPALRCPTARSPSKKQPEEEGAEEKGAAKNETQQVELTVRSRREHLEFSATRLSAAKRDGSKLSSSSFSVVAGRHLGRIDEVGVVFDLFEPGSAFLVPEPQRPTGEAVLKPPAPFSGRAKFSRESAAPPSWSGDLKVALPGFGVVPLTGPAVHASMCSGPSCPTP